MPKFRNDDKELQKIRETDKTAYRCIGCHKISTGFGARLLNGWVCSNECWDLAISEYNNVVYHSAHTMKDKT